MLGVGTPTSSARLPFMSANRSKGGDIMNRRIDSITLLLSRLHRIMCRPCSSRLQSWLEPQPQVYVAVMSAANCMSTSAGVFLFVRFAGPTLPVSHIKVQLVVEAFDPAGAHPHDLKDAAGATCACDA